jgi:hypothetical protein
VQAVGGCDPVAIGLAVGRLEHLEHDLLGSLYSVSRTWASARRLLRTWTSNATPNTPSISTKTRCSASAPTNPSTIHDMAKRSGSSVAR